MWLAASDAKSSRSSATEPPEGGGVGRFGTPFGSSTIAPNAASTSVWSWAPLGEMLTSGSAAARTAACAAGARPCAVVVPLRGDAGVVALGPSSSVSRPSTPASSTGAARGGSGGGFNASRPAPLGNLGREGAPFAG
jgi:hypothetical protein